MKRHPGIKWKKVQVESPKLSKKFDSVTLNWKSETLYYLVKANAVGQKVKCKSTKIITVIQVVFVIIAGNY